MSNSVCAPGRHHLQLKSAWGKFTPEVKVYHYQYFCTRCPHTHTMTTAKPRTKKEL